MLAPPVTSPPYRPRDSSCGDFHTRHRHHRQNSSSKAATQITAASAIRAGTWSSSRPSSASFPSQKRVSARPCSAGNGGQRSAGRPRSRQDGSRSQQDRPTSPAARTRCGRGSVELSLASFDSEAGERSSSKPLRPQLVCSSERVASSESKPHTSCHSEASLPNAAFGILRQVELQGATMPKSASAWELGRSQGPKYMSSTINSRLKFSLQDHEQVPRLAIKEKRTRKSSKCSTAKKPAVAPLAWGEAEIQAKPSSAKHDVEEQAGMVEACEDVERRGIASLSIGGDVDDPPPSFSEGPSLELCMPANVKQRKTVLRGESLSEQTWRNLFDPALSDTSVEKNSSCLNASYPPQSGLGTHSVDNPSSPPDSPAISEIQLEADTSHFPDFHDVASEAPTDREVHRVDSPTQFFEIHSDNEENGDADQVVDVQHGPPVHAVDITPWCDEREPVSLQVATNSSSISAEIPSRPWSVQPSVGSWMLSKTTRSRGGAPTDREVHRVHSQTQFFEMHSDNEENGDADQVVDVQHGPPVHVVDRTPWCDEREPVSLQVARESSGISAAIPIRPWSLQSSVGSWLLGKTTRSHGGAMNVASEAPTDREVHRVHSRAQVFEIPSANEENVDADQVVDVQHGPPVHVVDRTPWCDEHDPEALQVATDSASISAAIPIRPWSLQPSVGSWLLSKNPSCDDCDPESLQVATGSASISAEIPMRPWSLQPSVGSWLLSKTTRSKFIESHDMLRPCSGDTAERPSQCCQLELSPFTSPHAPPSKDEQSESIEPEPFPRPITHQSVHHSLQNRLTGLSSRAQPFQFVKCLPAIAQLFMKKNTSRASRTGKTIKRFPRFTSLPLPPLPSECDEYRRPPCDRLPVQCSQNVFPHCPSGDSIPLTPPPSACPAPPQMNTTRAPQPQSASKHDKVAEVSKPEVDNSSCRQVEPQPVLFGSWHDKACNQSDCLKEQSTAELHALAVATVAAACRSEPPPTKRTYKPSMGTWLMLPTAAPAQRKLGSEAQAVRIATTPRKANKRSPMTSGFALHFAARDGNLIAARMLITAHADPCCADERGIVPLHLAAERGHDEMVALLLSARASPTAATVGPVASMRGITALHAAAAHGSASVVIRLLAANARPESARGDGVEPMHFAAQGGHISVALALLAVGACPDSKGAGGVSPLHDAAYGGHHGVVTSLLVARACVDIADEEGTTPLHCAAQRGHAEVARHLLSNGASHSMRSTGDFTPLHDAAHAGHLNIIRQLLAASASASTRSRDGATPLHLAAQAGWTNVAAELAAAQIAQGESSAASSCRGATPLRLAAARGHMKVVRALRSQRRGRGQGPLAE